MENKSVESTLSRLKEKRLSIIDRLEALETELSNTAAAIEGLETAQAVLSGNDVPQSYAHMQLKRAVHTCLAVAGKPLNQGQVMDALLAGGYHSIASQNSLHQQIFNALSRLSGGCYRGDGMWGVDDSVEPES